MPNNNGRKNTRRTDDCVLRYVFAVGRRCRRTFLRILNYIIIIISCSPFREQIICIHAIGRYIRRSFTTDVWGKSFAHTQSRTRDGKTTSAAVHIYHSVATRNGRATSACGRTISQALHPSRLAHPYPAPWPSRCRRVFVKILFGLVRGIFPTVKPSPPPSVFNLPWSFVRTEKIYP